MSEKIAEISLNFINTVYSTDSQGRIVKQINWKSDGDLAVYGEGHGTLTIIENMNEANATGGPCSWTGEAFLPNGTRGLGTANGSWEKSGEHIWSVNWEGEDSIVGKIRFQGQIELSTNTLSGAVYSRDN
jgi:hypothetical protein